MKLEVFTMAKQRIILISVLCFTIVGFAGQRPKSPRPKPGMTMEEHGKAVKNAIEHWSLEKRKASQERINLMKREAWKRLLRISERQWKILEPRIDKVEVLIWTRRACARAWGGDDEKTFHWRRHSEGVVGPAKAPHEMIEGEKVADELVDLLEDENSKDEEIRKKTDELLQVREKAGKEFTEAKRELAAVLTTPRQEAIFLIIGRID
jgi:hypothetical protein